MRLWAAASFAFLLGCGAADQTRSARDDDESMLVNVNPRINICPHFEGAFILPQSIPRSTSAFIAVRTVDPDGNELDLAYEWSAGSGAFTAPDRPTTDYTCEAEGDQTLTLVATDVDSCDAWLHLDVTCLSQ
jgi:hypothetical protein